MASETAVNPSVDAPETRTSGDIWRCQISTLTDGTLPRDYVMCNPHLQDNSASGVDPQAVASSLANNMVTYLKSPYDVSVKLYKATGLPPHYPVASAIAGTAGNSVTSQAPREVALCLSYYASFNRPRFRGRLYIPFSWIYRQMATPAVPGVRPSASHQAAAGAFYTVVIKPACSGGVQWVVWSKVDQNSKVISNWYVDDEWDTIRSRGTKPTARTTGVVPQVASSLSWPVYTETFIRTRVAGADVNYTVPAGKRAIVTSVTASRWAVAASVGGVYIQQTLIAYFQLQAQYTSIVLQMRAVAYPGEVITCYQNVAAYDFNVSGYLFSSPAAAGYDDEAITLSPHHEVQGLPV